MAASDRRRIEPATRPLDAVIAVPGSKSITNRALVCAALADGTSRLARLAPGDDTTTMLDGLRSLGVDVRVQGDSATVCGGSPSAWPQHPITLQCGLAGTTSRFLTALAALGSAPVVVDGDEPLRRRPMAPLHEALTALGARLEFESVGHLPVVVSGPLTGTRVAVRGDVSSQFITALMLVAPALPDGLVIELTSPLVSRPYVAMTAQVMSAFGIDGIQVAEAMIAVPSAAYRSAEFEIEPDASSASYPLAAAAICGGRVRVPGLARSSMQGDAVFADLLRRMGADVRWDTDAVEVRGSGRLTGLGEIDLSAESDLVPTVATVAAFAQGATTVTGVGFIREKESDRIGDLAAELRACGATVHEHDDGLTVEGPASLHGATVRTHHDHRLAMALALIGLKVDGVVVEEPAVVSKSWPAYWTMLEALAS
jgi:3-phosphoshikimate 1-carboxyvinyltransferase